MHILLLIEDFYRLIMLIILTFLVIDSLQIFKKHLVRSFLETHVNDDMSRKLDHLTLMVMAKEDTAIIDQKLIRKFEKETMLESVGNILAISQIRDHRDAFKEVSQVRTTEFINKIESTLGLNKVTKQLLKSRLRKRSKFDQKILEKKEKIENGIENEKESSGITFVCFNSVLDLLRFKRYINPWVNKNWKRDELFFRVVFLRSKKAISYELFCECRGFKLGEFLRAENRA